jgi:hypothetical protein
LAKRGKRTPEHIRKFVIEVKTNAPGLSHGQIADRVAERFGEEAGVDKSTVGRILERAGLRGVLRDVSPTDGDWSSINPQLKQKHRDDLMSVLLELYGIDVFPLHHEDLATWYARSDSPCWPMAQGQVCRESDGSLAVQLNAEEKLEWQYLKQHLPGDPVWDAVEACKQALAGDFAARLALLNAVVQLIGNPVEEGGTELPVLAEMGYMGSTQPAVSLYYAFAIHDQVMSRSLNLRHAPHPRGAFQSEIPNTIHLAGQPVISSPDPTQQEAAVEFLLRAQKEWVSLPEAKAAAEAYRLAEHRTEEVKGHLDRLKLDLAFPKGSLCEGCKGWAT